MPGERECEGAVRTLIRHFADDATREGLRDTPRRVVEAWTHWTSGYLQDPGEVLKCFEDGAENYDTLVTVGNLSFFSLCEHHLAPFWGRAYVGYIPRGRIVGLSKIARVVEIFARRLQVQERMTRQIADTLQEHLNPLAVGVCLRARHSCMESRGVQKVGAVTTTSALTGEFKTDAAARAEFLRFTECTWGDAL